MQHFLNEVNRVVSEGKDTQLKFPFKESIVQKVLRYTKEKEV
jgi:hypothetical protein